MTGVDFAPDGNDVLVSSIGSLAQICVCDVCIGLEGLIALAEERSIRTLTPEERQTFL